MKKSHIILFPTDFSEPSANAFRYALKLADQMHSELVVLNVVYPAGDSGEFPEVAGTALRAQLDAAEAGIKHFVEKGLTQVLPSLSNGPKVVTSVEVGMPEGTIADKAESENVDLIVIGSRGENRSAIQKLFGSVAAGVVASAGCPVVVVPEDAIFKPLNTVAYATDAQKADPYEIWKSVQLLKPFKPTVRLVHVDMEKEGDLEAWEMMDELREFFEEQSSEMQVNFHYLIGEKLEDELNEFMDSYDVDMLIMYQPKHGFWDKLFHRSATKKMALKSDKPLLVQKD